MPVPGPSSFWTSLKAEFDPPKLLASFSAGTLTGVIGVIRAISYAALIFSESLSAHLDIGVGIAIFSSAIISILVAFLSSLPGMIATPLAAPTAVLAILSTNIASSLAGRASSSEIVLTVIAAIALGSVSTGFVLWLIGACRWGKSLQFIPYPVVGGFMAGTGWLLILGGLKVITGNEVTLSNLPELFQLEPSLHWISGFVIAVTLLLVSKRIQHPFALPGVLLMATVLLLGSLSFSGISFDSAHDQGWLLGPFPASERLWQPLQWSDFGQIHWSVIAQQSGSIGLLIFVSFMSLVMTNSGIELALERELNINQELKAVGLANMAAGLGSSMAGNQALPSTLLAHKLGAPNRLTGVFKTVPCFLVLILGPAFLAYFPKPILGSLLLFLGLDLLGKWVFQTWFKLPVFDYLIILTTLVLIGWYGFLPGILTGLGLSVLQFLIQAKQAAPIAPWLGPQGLSAPEFFSSNESFPENKSQFDTDEIPVKPLALQGHLFFGNATQLSQTLRSQALEIADSPTPNSLILDFGGVLSLDSSSVMTFSRLLKLAKTKNLCLVFISLSEPFQQQLQKGDALDLESEHSRIFPDLATAISSLQ